MDRQNILTGVKVLSNKSNKYNQNQYEEDQFLSIKQNTVIVRSKQNFKIFKFDCCLSKHSTQQQIYDNFCLSMVEDFVQGYDCTVILCGQNKSKQGFNQIIIGKDSQETKGLIPRFIDHITNSIRYLSQRKCLFKVSYLEINKEQIIDLLGVKKCKLQIKQEKQNKNQFYVNNLEIKSLQKIEEIQSFYLLGSRKKQYAYSKSYRKRQNSTALFTIYLQSLEQNGTIYRRSKFTFCQLSQNSFEEIQQISQTKNMHRTLSSNFLLSTERKESNYQFAKSLNLSDYAFQNVVNTLVYGDQNVNVPFRDSKVTKLLRSSLGGNHKTSILGTVDGQSQSSLQKTFKILKTLQIAAQIQNCPSNLKSIDSEQTYSGGHNIVSLLEQIQQLSHEVQKLKIDLQLLLSNPQYISEEVRKIKDQNGDSLTRQNQFCSEENLEDRVVEERTKKQSELRQTIKQLQKKLKENISYIHNLEEQGTNGDNDNDQFFSNQQSTISKRKQILMRIRKIKEHRLRSMPNLQLQQIQRQKKRQVFALQIQFQKQRNIYTTTIRNLEQKLSLYKKIAQNSLKTEEIQIIRANSRFDETKRQFLIPMFMIKDKKMRPGNMISPQISQRKFLFSPRSSSFNSNHSNSISKNSTKPLQMRRTNINKFSQLQSRRPQKRQQNINSQYQIEFNNDKISQKQGTKYQQFQKQRQLTARMLRNKSPLNQNKYKKNLTLMERIRSSEHIRNVRSQYEIEDIDVKKVIKYNEQRKTLKSRQKDINFSRDKSTGTLINLMRRQKLKTEIMSIDVHEEQNKICQTGKDQFSKSPLKKLKRWI